MTQSSLVRISPQAKKSLEALSRRTGAPMLRIIDDAVEAYRRRLFLEETNRAYARLRSDAAASAEFDREISAWDTTLNDGLEPESKTARPPVKKTSGGRRK